MAEFLTPGSVNLSTLADVYWNRRSMRLDPAVAPAIERAAARIATIAAGGAPVYGVNTGFGKLASIKIDVADVAVLQRNLILSHCCGVGAPLDESVVRLIITLKLMSLGRGASGVRPELVALGEEMLARGVTPVIPEKGSVGASGDLAPLAHMAAVMMGAGEAFVAGERLPGAGRWRRSASRRSRWLQRKGLRSSTAPRSRPRSRWRDCSAPNGPCAPPS